VRRSLLHLSKPASIHSRRRDEDEQWDNDAKQIPGQGTKVRKANLADPSGWSY
jgi:hypothetical protein